VCLHHDHAVVGLALAIDRAFKMVDAVAIAGHVRALAHGDAAAKARAAWALWRLMCPSPGGVNLSSEEPRNAITAAGATFLLVELLQSGGEGARCAAGALMSLAYNQDNVVAIVAAGGIAPLVDLVGRGCAGGKSNAALALGNLALNDDNIRVAIAAAGAIAPLIELVRSGNAEPKVWAAWALGILAMNADNQVAIAAAGAIEPLLWFVWSNSPGADNAQEALKTLAYRNVDNQVIMAEARGDLALLQKFARYSTTAKDAAARVRARNPRLIATRVLAHLDARRARRRLALVRKCVGGKLPTELEPAIAACLGRRALS